MKHRFGLLATMICLALCVLVGCSSDSTDDTLVTLGNATTAITTDTTEGAITEATAPATEPATESTVPVTRPVPETTAPTAETEPEPTVPAEKPDKESATEPTTAATEPTSSTELPAGTLVWIPTKGGKKYHCKPDCSNMDSPKEVTVEEAEEDGFTPCKRCYK